MAGIDQTRVLGTYYATEAATGTRVLVVLWDDSPDDILPSLSDGSLPDGVPVRVIGVLTQAALNEPEAVSSRDVVAPDVPYDDIFMSPERSALLAGHTNVQASTMAYQAARGWTIVVGVVAKGFIPDGETVFPSTVDVHVNGTTYTLAVDVRSVWIHDDYEF